MIQKPNGIVLIIVSSLSLMLS